MKITKEQLKRIIKEELENVLEDQTGKEHVIELVGVSSNERYYAGRIAGSKEAVYKSKKEARKFPTKAKAKYRADQSLDQVMVTSLEETQSEESTLTEGFQESYNWYITLPPEHQLMILKSIGYLTGISTLATAMTVGIEKISNRIKRNENN